MFKFKNNPQQNQPPFGYFGDNHLERILFQLDEANRKIKNLNNRLKRVGNFLGLRNEEKFDADNYYDDF